MGAVGVIGSPRPRGNFDYYVAAVVSLFKSLGMVSSHRGRELTGRIG